MEEAFLHFIWKFQKFNKKALTTSSGDALNIIKTGLFNSDAGPDFLNARIIVNDLTWCGNIEIHIKSSDWDVHRHQQNPGYNNVILHVVWHHDKEVVTPQGNQLPVLVLEDKINLELYDNYKSLISSISPVPCAFYLHKAPLADKFAMLDRSLISRLEAKARLIIDALRRNNNDWEETAYQILARNFGFKVNSESFYDLSKVLPYRLLKKHRDNLPQVEALLFGMANLIPENAGENGSKSNDSDGSTRPPKYLDEYSTFLKNEFSFLSHKYTLRDKVLSKTLWKFLRLRPANFPTIRLSQLAAILSNADNLFSNLIEITSLQQALKLFEVTQSSYWKHHYNFNKPSTHIPDIGEEAIGNILINTVAPLQVAYGLEKGDDRYLTRATSLLEKLKPENNKITRLFTKYNFPVNSAFDSQGLLDLYQNFCSARRCLDCNIGTRIIKEAI